jgi:hypothetical protein
VIDPAAEAYIEDISTDHRALFDRFRGLVVEVHPDVDVTFAYKMPTFVVGDRRLHVGAWKHGISLYGWDADHDGGIVARHPELSSGKGTLRLPTAAAGDISDDELRDLIRGALG